MQAPQIILIIVYSVSLLCNAYEHGKPKEGNNSIWTSLVSTAIVFGLLIWGGFFN